MADPLNPAEMPRLRVIVPSRGTTSCDEVCRQARALTAQPFAEARLAVLASLSQDLLRHPRLRRDPAGASLGFWLRRAHLGELEKDFRSQGARAPRVAAGLVFHIAPGNVDTMFIYSWALSFLAGNANIVRLSRQTNPLIEDLLACLDGVFSTAAETCSGNLFVAYDHDDATTEQLSAACDARIVWGGDETVRRIRAIPLNPHASERSFAGKRSFCVASATAFIAASKTEQQTLAERMAADIAPFGQMGCSSPQTMYWIGEPEQMPAVVADFEKQLQQALAAKGGEADLGWAVRRLNHAFGAAAGGTVIGVWHEPHTTGMLARTPAAAEAKEPCGVGLITHVACANLAEIGGLMRRDHQTVTYFGLTEAERDELAVWAGRAGVDRVVPVGRALDFVPQWDGYDLWTDLTRLVFVQ
jgi:hypothetical protein